MNQFKLILIICMLIVFFNKINASTSYNDLKTIGNDSICIILPPPKEIVHPTYQEWIEVLRDGKYNNIKLLCEEKGDKPVNFEKLPMNLTVPFLSLCGGHMSYHDIWGGNVYLINRTTGQWIHSHPAGTLIETYHQNVVQPLVTKRFKSKLILLDSCISLALLPAFIQLLTENGILIAKATDSEDPKFSQKTILQGALSMPSLKSTLLENVGNLNEFSNENLEALFTFHYESLNKPGIDRTIDILKVKNPKISDDEIRTTLNSTNFKKIAELLIRAGIKRSCCGYVIYKNSEKTVYYDRELTEGFGSVFQKSTNELLVESFNECKRRAIKLVTTLNSQTPIIPEIKFQAVDDFTKFIEETFPTSPLTQNLSNLKMSLQTLKIKLSNLNDKLKTVRLNLAKTTK